MSTVVTVAFEYTDAHMSIIDDGSDIEKLERKCIKLCQVFKFRYKPHYRRIDDTPNWVFSISFDKDILSFDHKMNVLRAFAQEFQILIANVFEEPA